MIERIDVDMQTPAQSIDADVWDALTESGFTAIGIPEAAGGSGGALADALTVLSTVSESGALTPFLEHTLLASWLAAEAGYELGSATATVGIGDARCTASVTGETIVLDGTVEGIVHAAVADTFVVLVAPAPNHDSPRIAVVSATATGLIVHHGTDLVGASVAEVTFEATPVLYHSSSPIDVTEVQQRGALAYTVALAAAARAVRDQTLRYANERTQFGRPLSKFQAIQQQLARLAALTAMAQTAAAAAVEESEAATPASRAATAAAKVVASSAAREIAATGHQIHGAIGFTSEHRLGRYTTSLWTWRDRHGSERHWASALANRILDDGADVWDVIVGVDRQPCDDQQPPSGATGGLA
nr:acyl-CoA dehydrogenase family protein [Rhodococcus jostii]